MTEDPTTAEEPAEEPEAEPAKIGRNALLTLVFFASGAVLVLEILAGRLMAPFVGVSLETFTGVIGTILAGIAVGSALGGRLADRRPPEKLLGPTLVLGGALAWVAVPIIAFLGPRVDPGPVSIVFLAGVGFFAPAAVLSAIGPMAAKLELADLRATGSVVGSLSAAGTAGALVGTFVTGFVLIAALPTRPIIIVLGAALIIAGVALSWRYNGRRIDPTAAALIGVACLLATFSGSPCQFESAYACGRVEVDPDRASGRSLYLDRLRHSYVDLDDPTFLDIRYIRLFADVADSLPPGALDALHLGGAGFSFPGYLEAVRPGTNSLVLEIDDELVRVAQDDLGLELSDQLEVRIGDARLALPDLDDDAYDLIVGDAFGGSSVPWHLTTAEVMDEIDRLLRPDGLYVMNVIDGADNRFARAQTATLLDQFDHVAVIVPEEGIPATRPVNQVLIASAESLPEIPVGQIDGRLLTGDDVNAFVDGAPILTDDHAPVDQLMLDF